MILILPYYLEKKESSLGLIREGGGILEPYQGTGINLLKAHLVYRRKTGAPLVYSKKTLIPGKLGEDSFTANELAYVLAAMHVGYSVKGDKRNRAINGAAVAIISTIVVAMITGIISVILFLNCCVLI